MGHMFMKDGKLNIPVSGGIDMSKGNIVQEGDEIIVNEAYCSQGHSLISDIEIEGRKGIHFIYADESGERETEIVISPIVRKARKTILKGEPFHDGETVKILCPTCREELPILVNCECGAPIYLFYLDKELNHRYAHSFCSRIGCVKASRLRLSDDVLREIVDKNAF